MRAWHLDLLADCGRWLADEREVIVFTESDCWRCCLPAAALPLPLRFGAMPNARRYHLYMREALAPRENPHTAQRRVAFYGVPKSVSRQRLLSTTTEKTFPGHILCRLLPPGFEKFALAVWSH